jgi:hypothetical protein
MLQIPLCRMIASHKAGETSPLSLKLGLVSVLCLFPWLRLHFYHKWGFANGIACAGCDLGSAVISISMYRLMKTLWHSWTFRIIWILQLATRLSAAWLIKERHSTRRNSFLDWHLFSFHCTPIVLASLPLQAQVLSLGLAFSQPLVELYLASRSVP